MVTRGPGPAVTATSRRLRRVAVSMPGFLEGLASYLASFSDTERAVSRHAFRGILAGRPVARDGVAAALGLAAEAADAAIDRDVARGTMLIEDGRIVAARGLSMPATAHALDVGARRLHAFCAVDAVGIPVALALDARVASACFLCGAAVGIRTARGAVIDAPDQLVIWAVDRDPERSLRAHT